MQELLEQAGYEIVPFAPGADVYVINTCTVTNMADRKSRQMLHRAKKMNPDAVVVAAGCYVQAAAEEAAADEAIDIIIGNNQKKDLVNILENFRKGEKLKTECSCDGDCGDNCTCKEEPESQEAPTAELASMSEEEFAASVHETRKYLKDLTHEKEYEELKITHTTEHTRAYIKVQDGCNQFCSYCIIPYVRGRVRSRKKEDVLTEVERLTKNGYQEFVLTGIHLSSYGVDCGETLLSLIQDVHAVPGVKRIRLGSLEPRIVTEEFAAALGSMPKICPHFHLSLQSGCNETLKRMNRRYTAEEYLKGCEILRKHFENPALTTDVIVGFPGETEEEFAESKAMIEQADFYETHIFKYSRRQGTRADGMENQVLEQVKTERSHVLIQLGKEHMEKYMSHFVGQEVEILFEETMEIKGETYWTGHTKEYLRAAVKTEKNLENCIRTGKVVDSVEDGIFICTI